MGNKLALAALVLAVAALLLHALAGPRAESVRARDVPDEAGVTALEERVAVLESALEELRRSTAASALVPAAPPADREPMETDGEAAPDARLDELAGRLERLEQRLSTPEPDEAERAARFELERLMGNRMTVDEAAARARDLAATEEQRLQGLRALRGQRLADGTDARLLALDDMLELARTSQDGGVRADVWRNLSGVTDRRLLQPLLDALAHDTNVNAREEAAETLADFLPDRAAESALRHAAESDPDRGVREQARESLDG
jgi:hypothetical protein